MHPIRPLALCACLCACGASPVAAPTTSARDPDRAALVARLCEPLPTRAYECVVGWPSAVAPGHREGLEIASEGSFWARGPGVRAFARCTDRAAEEGHAAEIVVVLVDTSVTSPEAFAEQLPYPGVRWRGECGSEDDCRTFLGAVEGDRLVLRRRVERPAHTDENVAHLACSAVVDGAEEARAWIDAGGALVREVDVRPAGARLATRRAGGRGDTEHGFRSWQELALEAGDQRIERASDVRRATVHAPLIDPERADVSELGLVERQLEAREAQVARGRSPEALAALARLAARAFEAHPSHPEYAETAVRAAVENGDVATARSVAQALVDLVGEAEPEAARALAFVAIAAHDPPALEHVLALQAPDLAPAVLAAAADALMTLLGPLPLTHDAILSREPFTRVLFSAARAASVRMRRTETVTLAPATGATWAILALASEAGRARVVVCGDAGAQGGGERRASPRGHELTIAALGSCAAAEIAEASALDHDAALAALLPRVQGPARILLERDGTWIGLGGRVTAAGALEVDRATAPLTSGELARAQARVVAPIAVIGTRTFPAPTLHVPVPTTEREAALSAASSPDTVCALETTGLACTPRAGRETDVLFDAALRIFGAR